MRTVLLGGAGSGTAFGLATALRRHWGQDVRLIGMDINPPEHVTTSLLCDRFVIVPRTDNPNYEATLQAIVSDEKISDFVPILNGEIAFCGQQSETNPNLTYETWVTPLQAQIATDKIFASQWLSDKGIAIPQTISPQDAGSYETVFFKPRSGSGSIGSHRLRGADVVAMDPDVLAGGILQQLCDGPELTIDSVSDRDQNVVRAICRERLEVKSGVCTKARIFHDAELEHMAKTIARALGQVGALCFQVMRYNDNWVVTDLNIRTGAGSALSVAVGFDVLGATFAARWGDDLVPYLSAFNYEKSHTVTRQYSEFVMQ